MVEVFFWCRVCQQNGPRALSGPATVWGSTEPGHSGLDRGAKLRVLTLDEGFEEWRKSSANRKNSRRKMGTSCHCTGPDSSGPISPAFSGPNKAWLVTGADLLTSQAAALAASGLGLAVPGSLVSPLLGAWLSEAYCQQQAASVLSATPTEHRRVCSL